MRSGVDSYKEFVSVCLGLNAALVRDVQGRKAWLQGVVVPVFQRGMAMFERSKVDSHTLHLFVVFWQRALSNPHTFRKSATSGVFCGDGVTRACVGGLHVVNEIDSRRT